VLWHDHVVQQTSAELRWLKASSRVLDRAQAGFHFGAAIFGRQERRVGVPACGNRRLGWIAQIATSGANAYSPLDGSRISWLYWSKPAW